MSFQSELEKYAELAVKTGVNVQPGQTLVVTASIQTAELVRLIVKKAYLAGAKHVYVDWNDETVTRLKYDLAPDEAFSEFPQWKVQAREKVAEEGGAFLHVDSNDPELLAGVDPKRISAASKTAGQAMKKWQSYIVSDKISWSIIGAASPAWAQKVFPDKEVSEAVDALWNAIFQATRVNRENPVDNWRQHNATLHEKVSLLNRKRLKKLHYRAPGTDLTVELPDRHLWSGGASENDQGVPFNANIPTEEVYTSPVKSGTHGVVTSTKPLSYQGNLIENFTLRFEEGRVVDFQAEKGYDTLKNLLESDEGARYLGEIALVPHDSPISNTNLIFLNTLFDENASCHLALGKAFSFCVEGSSSMKEEELAEIGLNDSITHVDFMIGSDQLDIDGETADGSRIPIFRQGNWAF
ncbi:aminopeptidase [Melghirimyces thermohalophilus]|uniref:Aminopeptidase n=1 Tax=Melghirimyces thermohalophilus TaxID=1236220 RepID=A0A1G6QJ39_9BACL|nr:aminopeptidase [Melghirimyces thermohalophilus]SDC92181.1 aminopeptidase [Melghirimyces thermohalophilus]